MVNAAQRISSSKTSSLGISQVLEDDQPKRIRRSTTLPSEAFKEPSEHDTCFGWSRFIISLYFNKIAVNIFGGLNGWKWYNRIDEVVMLGALPTPLQIKELHQHQNLHIIINLCAEFPGYRGLYTELGIRQICLETTDFTIPSLERIEIGVDAAIEAAENNQDTVYIHCKAGRGRSAAVSLCYLIRRYQLSPAEAQDILIKARAQVDKELYQTEQIRMYYKNVIMDQEAGRISRIPYTYSSLK